MKIRILTLLLSFSLFLSCNNNDNSIQNETIIGIWNLKNVSGGFPGVDIDYENVLWKFVSETNVLIVESSLINNGPQSVYLPLQSGNYNYSLTELNGKTFIIIEGFRIFNNGEYGRYKINDNNLMIDQGEGSEANASDVFILQFER
ncbi:MAG: hypothetical protein COB73_01340 [Flavobacteriaceae bacterium]|nr:MAG: hypothetical protein COB73_01340 [Flavobacteriaceae bacterium]